MALQTFRRALSIERKVPHIWMHYGACLHDTHQYEDAREAFHLVHKVLPKDPMPLANIAATYVQQGKANQALEFADKALAINLGKCDDPVSLEAVAEDAIPMLDMRGDKIPADWPKVYGG